MSPSPEHWFGDAGCSPGKSPHVFEPCRRRLDPRVGWPPLSGASLIEHAHSAASESGSCRGRPVLRSPQDRRQDAEELRCRYVAYRTGTGVSRRSFDMRARCVAEDDPFLPRILLSTARPRISGSSIEYVACCRGRGPTRSAVFCEPLQVPDHWLAWRFGQAAYRLSGLHRAIQWAEVPAWC